MLLRSVQVKNYKIIKDSTEFNIDEKITCLVGKNESGKTALLQAIAKLNPVDPDDGNFDILEYPRTEMTEYQHISDQNPADVLITRWMLSPEDIEKLENIVGPAARQIGEVQISRGHNNQTIYGFSLDEKTVAKYILCSHELMEDEKKNLQDVDGVQDMVLRLGELEDPSQRQKDLLDFLTSEFGEDSAKKFVDNQLHSELPKIEYFSEYLRMPGQISINEIKARQANNTLTAGQKVFLALLYTIGRSVEDLEQIDQHEMLTAQLEGASNNISRQIFRYWSQNRHLRVQIRFEQGMTGDPTPFNEGWIIRTRIENTRHGVITSFDERSAGFVWFFSFLVWFSQIRRRFGDNLIILLDEPGLSLHAKAQSDLLRYIEEQLAPNFQIIYTTHSPFMVDPTNLLRARTVEDVYLEPKDNEQFVEDPELGSKVSGRVLSTDKDTLFPLQAALGYEITQSLFIGEHTVLVEGPSEILYFQWFNRKLQSMDRTALDKRWVISPCGGIDRIPAFLSLLTGNKLNIAVVTDIAKGQKRRVRDIRESNLLKQGRVLTMDMYTDQEEADIEDMIGRDAYIELVKQTYSLPQQHRLLDTKPAEASNRVVKEVEEFFRILPPEIEEFDHFRPSEYLIQQGSGFPLPGIDEALDRFESLFRDLNGMLD